MDLQPQLRACGAASNSDRVGGEARCPHRLENLLRAAGSARAVGQDRCSFLSPAAGGATVTGAGLGNAAHSRLSCQTTAVPQRCPHPPEANGLNEGAEHVAAPVLQRQARDGAPAQRVGVGRAVALQRRQVQLG